MQSPKIKSAKSIDDHTILVEFVNSQKRKYDFVPLFKKEMFSPLKNPAFFINFQVDSTGCGIVWNEDIDISEYELWNNGTESKKDSRKG
ncbi:MAG: DUF2442 domain-containing protein [Pseudomonadota bacterium]